MTITQPDLSVFETLESEVRSYCRGWPTVFDRAQGSRMYDEDGHAYLDFFAGAGSLNYGHNNPRAQTGPDRLPERRRRHARPRHVHHRQADVPGDLPGPDAARRAACRLQGQFPGPTGTNAVEAALKLARKVTGRETICRFTNAFHGMSLGALAVTGNAIQAGRRRRSARAHARPCRSTTTSTARIAATSCWFERLLEDSGSGLDKPAAVIVETVQGEGGINVARREWLQRARRTCASGTTSC